MKKEEGEKNQNQNSEEVKVEKPKSERDEVQITISIECERKMAEALARINQGFEIGRVTRKHLAVYVIEKVLAQFTEEDVQAVRQSTLTDFALLDKLYRDAKSSGVVPDALKEILWKSVNLSSGPKRAKRSGQAKHSTAIPKEEEAA